MDVAVFRTQFPEFTSTTVYPTSQIEFWATVAEAQLIADIWGTVWTTAVKLYVAHEITLAAQNSAAGATGGTPGMSGGPPQSKAVGSVNVSYDSTSTSEKDAGWWNLTTYGKQLYRLMRLYGAGCVQL